MYASTWHFQGNPDDLAPKYEALLGELGTDGMLFHSCVRTDDGILLFDTCPDKETFESFSTAPWFLDMIERNGLPRPTIIGHEIISLFANGEVVDLEDAALA